MNQDLINAAKTKHSGQLYHGEVSFVDEDNNRQELEFIYRRPQIADMEMFQQQVMKNPFDAQANLLVGLIVEPTGKDIIEKLRPYPFVIASFVNEQLTPFFGSEVATKSKKI